MKERNKKVAERLIKLRGKKSRREVAEAVGVSTSAIAMYEQGRRIPKDCVKKSIAKFYKKSIDSIFFA